VASVRILLPPSEAKNAGGRGLPLDGRRRRQPIEDSRELVFRALARLLTGPDPAGSLLLPPSIAAAAIGDNERVRTAATLPALRRYAGVVYDGLAATELSPAARAAADRDVLIFSGLFGVLRGGDPVPPYRVPAKASLPGLGVLSTFWKSRLSDLMPALVGRELILDLRSSDYASMWQPARNSRAADRQVNVRVLSPKPDGSLGVISFPSKLAKGKLAAALLERQARGQRVTDLSDVAQAWAAAGGLDAIERATEAGSALDLITETSLGPTAANRILNRR
jgi:cytoplasmic iron level regulating protein YaaA (DUF328/UPF0246 family)